MTLDRLSRSDFSEDPFISDVRELVETALPVESVPLIQVSTSASAVEVLFERRSGHAVLLWDTDFTERLDGLLSLVFCGGSDTEYDYQGLGIAALSNLTASLFLARDPAVSDLILRLASDFISDDLSVIVEDDFRMDRYRRLIRAYVCLHEIAHIVYRLLPERRKAVDTRLRASIAAIRPTMLAERNRVRSAVDEDLAARGFLLQADDLNQVLGQIDRHLRRPADYEEVWCDVFAGEHFLAWAIKYGFRPEECAVTDELLHLLLGARMQWTSFWDRRNDVADWQASPGLNNHENRAHIRSLLLVSDAVRAWLAGYPAESEAGASEAMAALIAVEGDALRKRMVDRHNLALGLLGGLDRAEMFDLADRSWASLTSTSRSDIVAEIFEMLS